MDIRDVIFLLMFIIILGSTFVLGYRYIKEKDISILGSILPRLYLLWVIAFVELDMPVDWIFIHVGLLVVLLSDLIVSIFRECSKNLRIKIQANKMTQTLNDLSHKYNTLSETVPIGIFTSDLMGTVEKANSAVDLIFGEPLIGKNIFEVVGIDNKKLDTIRNLKEKESLVYTSIKIQTVRGTKNINLIVVRTRNGHETITGSIQEV